MTSPTITRLVEPSDRTCETFILKSTHHGTCNHEKDMNSVIAEVDKLSEISNSSVPIFPQAGYYERCMEFEKDEFIAALESPFMKLKELQPGFELHVLSTPLCTSNCKATGEILASIVDWKSAPFAVRSLSHIVRLLRDTDTAIRMI